jgi:hypothetical protein
MVAYFEMNFTPNNHYSSVRSCLNTVTNLVSQFLHSWVLFLSLTNTEEQFIAWLRNRDSKGTSAINNYLIIMIRAKALL